MNNFTMESILSELRNGTDLDTIASSMTDLINEAATAYEAEQKESRQVDSLREALIPLISWMNTYYDQEVSIDSIDLSHLISLLDLTNSLADVASKISLPKTTNKEAFSFEDFFKAIGI